MTHFYVSQATAKVIEAELSRERIWYACEQMPNGEVKVSVKNGNPYIVA